MKKILVNKNGRALYSFGPSFTIPKYDKVNGYSLVFDTYSCRTQLTDRLFRHYACASYKEAALNFHKGILDATCRDGEAAFVISNPSVEYFIKNLPLLHKKEKKAKLSKLTEIYEIGINGNYLVIGDPLWKSCLWKVNLYTFYLKHLFSKDFILSMKRERYWKSLADGNEEIYLSKIAGELKEIYDKDVYGEIPNYDKVHFCTGFVTIAQGGNNPMAELLGITPKVEKDKNYTGYRM
jgi:hypothetical protein